MLFLLPILWICGFFVGSIPFGVLIPRLLGKGDPRTMGSKSTGATNVYRLGGFWCAFAVYFFDMLKGYVFCFLGSFFLHGQHFSDSLLHFHLWIIGFFVVMGHIFSFFLGGKGGKGIATASGVLLYMAPLFFLLSFLLWVVLKKITHYVSLACLGSLVFVFLLLCFKDFFHEALGFLPLMGLIVFAHRDNIKRLLEGQELPSKNPSS